MYILAIVCEGKSCVRACGVWACFCMCICVCVYVCVRVCESLHAYVRVSELKLTRLHRSVCSTIDRRSD